MNTHERLEGKLRTAALAAEVPRPIVDTLQTLARRIRRIILLPGAMAVAAVAIATLLGMMAIDALFSFFSPVARWLLSLGGLAIFIAACAWYLVRPLRRKLGLTTVARMVEEHHPELQERISSAYELLATSSQSQGSELLINALAKEATANALTVDPKREVSTRTLKPYLIAAAILATSFILTYVIWPEQAQHLLAHTLAPYRDLATAQALNLDVDPGNAVVPIGEPLTITVHSKTHKLAQVDLIRTDSTSRQTVQPMLPQGGERETSTYALTFPKVLSSFDYSIRAGDAKTQTFKITAVARPKIETLELHYEYPAYTGIATEVITAPPGPIVAPAGTKVMLVVTANQPIDQAEFAMGDAVSPPSATDQDRSRYTWTIEMKPGTDTQWSIRLVVRKDGQEIAGSSERATNCGPSPIACPWYGWSSRRNAN